jgi:amidophosphoribosyltransferase
MTPSNVRHSNVYGIDMPSPHELVAHNRTTEEIAAHIGADLVIFQTLPDLIDSCRRFNPAIKEFDCSVFTGEYVTGGVTGGYLEHLQKLRSDKAKAKKDASGLDHVRNGVDGEMEVVEQVEERGCTGGMSECCRTAHARTYTLTLPERTGGSDSLVGLSNHSPKIGPANGLSANDEIGLHNSYYGS